MAMSVIVLCPQMVAEASQARSREGELAEELDDAKEGLHRSTARAAELKKRHEQGR